MSDRAVHIDSYRNAFVKYYADLSAVISKAINADFAAKNPEAKDKIAVVADYYEGNPPCYQVKISAENGGTEKFWEYLKPLEEKKTWDKCSGNQISFLFAHTGSMLETINGLLGDSCKITKLPQVPEIPKFMNAGVSR